MNEIKSYIKQKIVEFKTIINSYKDDKGLFKFEDFVYENIKYGLILIALFTFFVGNYLINVIAQVIKTFSHDLSFNLLRILGPQNILNIFTIVKYPIFYILLLIVVALATASMYFNVKASYQNINIGQQGDDRWTTLKEIKEQYKEIPQKTERYEGGGGFPVCRIGDKIYIDDSPVNNLVIGITRSGKTECLVYPLIDIYSRAEKQASMVVSDPKLELFLASYDTLKKRGYDVYCLNLVSQYQGMAYNPLQLVIDNWKTGNFDEAEMLARTFATSIFDPSKQKNDPFWAKASVNLMTALILAHVEDCLALDEKENALACFTFAQKQIDFEKLNNDEKEEVRKIVKKKIDNGELINDFLDDVIAIPTECEFIPSKKNEKCINMYSIVQTFTALLQEKGDDDTTGLDAYFNTRPDGNRAKGKYADIGVAGDKTKGSIFTTFLADVEIFNDEKNGKMTAFSQMNLVDVGFGKKPVAVFLGIPDYDKSNHFIASVFIRQLYFELAKTATFSKGGKCLREVIFLLDEFGNLPPIEGMDSIITVCLGRNIRFDLIIQAYAQLENLYDKGPADTIIGNCGNQMYIQTSDNDTASKFSESLGNKTIRDLSRSGKRFSLDKSYNETNIKQPLLNMNQLMLFKEGENAIKRVMKRQDINRNPIKPHPIHNYGKTKFTYRYEYLGDDFPQNKTLDDLELDKSIKNYNLREATFDYQGFFNRLGRIRDGEDVDGSLYADVRIPLIIYKESVRKRVLDILKYQDNDKTDDNVESLIPFDKKEEELYVMDCIIYGFRGLSNNSVYLNKGVRCLNQKQFDEMVMLLSNEDNIADIDDTEFEFSPEDFVGDDDSELNDIEVSTILDKRIRKKETKPKYEEESITYIVENNDNEDNEVEDEIYNIQTNYAYSNIVDTDVDADEDYELVNSAEEVEKINNLNNTNNKIIEEEYIPTYVDENNNDDDNTDISMFYESTFVSNNISSANDDEDNDFFADMED